MTSQTTDGKTFRKARVIVSSNGSDWTDVSGHGASVAVSGGDRAVGEQPTFEGDTPIVSAGKRAAIQLTVRYVYTEETGDPFEVARAAYEAEGGTFYCQYAVEQGGFWYKTGEGVLQNPGYPQGEAGGSETVMSEFVMTCAKLEKAAASG